MARAVPHASPRARHLIPIERLLADPRRIIAVRTNMNLGQTVRFLDWRDGQMRNGKVVARTFDLG